MAGGPSISFRQIRLFDAVGRLGSVTRAGIVCGLSQPAATQALAALQRQLGATLLSGGRHGTSLTAAGKLLHERLSIVLRKLELGLEELGIADIDNVVRKLSHTQLSLFEQIRNLGSLEQATATLTLSRRHARNVARQLEELVGFDLLVRTGNGDVLTERGLGLIHRIGFLSEECSWIIADAGRIDRYSRQAIVVGVGPDPGTSLMGSVLKAVSARHPDLSLELHEAALGDLLTRLVAGKLDMVVGEIASEYEGQIQWEVISTQTFRVVSRRDHPLTLRAQVTTDDFLRHHWVLGHQGSQRRAASDSLFARTQQPHCALATSAPPLMSQMLVESDRLGLMTEYEARIRSHLLAELPCSPPDVQMRIGWAYRQGWSPTAAHLDTIDRIKQLFDGST